MPLRETRRFKTKGFVISFGDIMLPLVGFVAVGLLLVAGKLFFQSAPQGERPVLPVIPGASPPSAASQERAARAETPSAAQPQPQTPVQAQSQTQTLEQLRGAIAPVGNAAGRRDPALGLDVLAVPYGGGKPSSDEPPNSVTVTSQPTSGGGKKQSVREPVSRSTPGPGAQNQRGPVQIQSKPPVPPPPPASVVKAAPAPAPAAQEKTSGWMVQVGAFSTPTGASVLAQRLTRAGYQPVVLPGKWNRVLVQAGSTKEEAVAQAKKMSQSGFEGAFVVPSRS